MNKILEVWRGELPPIPDDELGKIRAAVPEKYHDLCSCFWLFRQLHEVGTPEAALLGDYCFGRFSHHLAAIDSVQLTNDFSAWLQGDIRKRKTMEDFLAFAVRIPETAENGHSETHK